MTDFSSKTVASLRESGFQLDEKRLEMGNCFEHSFYINDKKITKTCYMHPDNHFCFLNIPEELFDSFEENINFFKQMFLKESNHFLFIFDSDSNNSIYKIFTHEHNKHMHSMLEILKKDLYARRNKLLWKYDRDDYTVLCRMEERTIQLSCSLHHLEERLRSPEEALFMYERIKQSENEVFRIEKEFQKELDVQSQGQYVQQNLKPYRIRKELKSRGSIQNFDFEFYLIGAFEVYKIQDLNQSNLKEIVHDFLKNIKIVTIFLQIAKKYDPFLFLMTDNYYEKLDLSLFLFKREFGLYIKRKEENGDLKHVLLLVDRAPRKIRETVKRTEICFSIEQFEDLFKKHIKSLRTQSLFQDNNLKTQFFSWQTNEQKKKRVSEDVFLKWFETQYKDSSGIPFLNKEKKSEFINSLSSSSQ